MTYKLNIYQDTKKRWRCHIRHRNGRIIVTTSEGDGYSRRIDCERAVRRVLEHAAELLAALSKPVLL